MLKDPTTEEKIEAAIKEVHDAMIKHVHASKAIVDATLAREKTKYALQEAKKRLASLETELMGL